VKKITVTNLMDRIPTEAAAYEYLEKLRWPDKPVCPHCGSINDHYYLKPANSVSRKTRTGSVSERRVWKCKDCRRQFSVLTGTIFHGSKVPVRTWLLVFFEMCANKNGIAAREIERKYGVHPKTAWFMAHRIREAMKSKGAPMLSGVVVVADETWIGGEPKNMHADKRAKSRGKGYTDQTPVLSLVEVGLEGSKSVRSRVLTDVRGETLRAAIAEQAELRKITLWTDSAKAYDGLKVARHERVNHKQGQYVNRGAGTNTAENYFSQLKRSLDGTHHNISKPHLHRYLAEFDFRYSTREISDTERMARLMGQITGRRLAYKQIVD